MVVDATVTEQDDTTVFNGDTNFLWKHERADGESQRAAHPFGSRGRSV